MGKALLLTAGVVLAMAAALIAAALYGNRVHLMRPPGPMARLATYLGQNVAVTGAGARLPELRPIVLRGEHHGLLDAVAQACRELQWRHVRVDPAARRVDAQVVSALFRFVDDVSIELRDAGDAVEARVRSASRVGRGDLGANARHVMDLRAALAARGLTENDGS
jgi:uncharacterized protein (DUF1499 family)